MSLFFLASCHTTKHMWHPHYEEDITKVVSSKDGKNIVFIGEKFNYVFEDSTSAISKMLELEKRKVLTINDIETDFEVEKATNRVVAHIEFETADFRVKEEDFQLLQSLGFKDDGVKNAFFYKTMIEGYRVQKDHAIAMSEEYNEVLDEENVIEVSYRPDSSETLKNSLLTPFTLMIDLVLFVGEAILMPFAD